MTEKNYFFPIRQETLPYTFNFNKSDGTSLSDWVGWDSTQTNGSAYFNNGSWRVDLTGGSSSAVNGVSAWRLQGNFQVEIEYSMPTWSVDGGGDKLVYFRVYSGDLANYIELQRRSNTRLVIYSSTAGVAIHSDTSFTDTTNLRFRITRTGNTILHELWNGSGWTALDNLVSGGDATWGTDDVRFQWALQSQGTFPAFVVDVHEVTINYADGVTPTKKFIDDFEGGRTPPIINSFDFNGTQVADGDTTYWSNHNLVAGTMQLISEGTAGFGTTLRYKFTGDWTISYKLDPAQYDLTNTGWQFITAIREVGNNNDRVDTNIRVPYLGQGLKLDHSAIVAGAYISGGSGWANFPSEPIWLRKRRVGNTFYEEYSTNGSTWNTLGSSPKTYTHMTGELELYFQFSRWTSTATKEFFIDDFNITADTIEYSVDVSELPTENWWLAQGTTVGQVINDKLTFHDTVQSQYGGVKSEFLLLGDFDIQVDIGLALDAAINTSAYTRLQIRLDDTLNNRLQIHKRISNTPDDDWVVEYNLEGVWQTGVVEEDTSPTGTARIEKIGTTLNIYLNTGSGKSLIDTRTTAYATSRILLDCSTAGSGSTSTFTNFIINSCDRMVWPYGTLKRYADVTPSTLPWTDEFNTINTDYWTELGIDVPANKYIEQLDGIIRFHGNTPVSGQPYLKSDFLLQGDFDIEMNSVGGTYLDTINRRFAFQVYDSVTSTNCLVRHGIDGVVGRRFNFQSSTVNVSQAIADVSDFVKFRLVRSGNTITGYGTELGGTEYSYVFPDTFANDCWCRGIFRVDQPPICYIDVDNFKINSADGITGVTLGQWTPTYMNNFIQQTGTTFTETFDGSNGDVPNPTYWTTASVNTTIQNNQLNHYNASPSQGTTYSVSTFELQGEFDIQVDAAWGASAVAPTSPFQLLRMDVGDVGGGGTRYMYIALGVDARWGAYDGTTWHVVIDPASVAGQLRIVRDASNNIYGYYWSGSQWEWNGNTSGQLLQSSSSVDKIVRLGFQLSNDGVFDGNFDNFKINSADTVTWNGAGDWTDSILKRPILTPNQQVFLDDFENLPDGAVVIDDFSPSVGALNYVSGVTISGIDTVNGNNKYLSSSSGSAVIRYNCLAGAKTYTYNALQADGAIGLWFRGNHYSSSGAYVIDFYNVLRRVTIYEYPGFNIVAQSGSSQYSLNTPMEIRVVDNDVDSIEVFIDDVSIVSTNSATNWTGRTNRVSTEVQPNNYIYDMSIIGDGYVYNYIGNIE